MQIRKLRMQDAPLMLEWMHDNSVVKYLQAGFASKTIHDCEVFIEDSIFDNENLHLAIVDESDLYQGTVSLKNIHDNTAEFAIAIRQSAMGRGIAAGAMKQIIDIGFNEKGLDSIYWCVSPDNRRAVRFYDKNGYNRVPSNTLKMVGNTYSEKQIREYFWYLITKTEKI